MPINIYETPFEGRLRKAFIITGGIMILSFFGLCVGYGILYSLEPDVTNSSKDQELVSKLKTFFGLKSNNSEYLIKIFKPDYMA